MSRLYHRPLSRGLLLLSLLPPFSLLLCQSLRATPQVPSQTRPQRAHSQPATPLPTSTQPLKFKGIFEPVNYDQDLTLFDAFFVSPEEGWVVGAAGTILHTANGGKTWTAQLGGDPQSAGPALKRLFFLDRRHGWAQNGDVLLRTTDGENWQQVASDVRGDVVFTNPRVGFRGYGGIVYQTLDGGATWKQIYTCATRVVAQGLTQQITCDVAAIHFPSPRVGYGVGTNNGVLGGGVVVKTEDGGASWKVIFVPQESGDQRTNVVFFLDDNSGFAFRNTGMYRTTDGGRSWQGVAATLPRNDVPLRFADPDVGWVVGQLPASGTARLTYTADGGAHWLARDLHFPAVMHGFSLPRRDRGYIVGEHGMVYRYRVVPSDYVVANMLPAPLMPGFDSPLNGEVATLKTAVNDLATQMQNNLGITAPPQVATSANVATAPQTAGVGFQQSTQPVGAPAGSNQTGFQQSTQAQGQDTSQGGFQQSTTNAPGQNPSAGGFQQSNATTPGPDASAGGFQQPAASAGIVSSCCGPTLQKLETAASTFATDLPQFSGKFRNLNLITSGLQFINDLLQRTNALKLAINNLRQAHDKQSAAAALGVLSGQVNSIPADVNGGFVQDTSSAFPQQPAQTPMSFGTGTQPVNQLAGNQPSSAQPPPAQQPADQGTNPVTQGEKAKEKLKDKLKKKIPW